MPLLKAPGKIAPLVKRPRAEGIVSDSPFTFEAVF